MKQPQLEHLNLEPQAHYLAQYHLDKDDFCKPSPTGVMAPDNPDHPGPSWLRISAWA